MRSNGRAFQPRTSNIAAFAAHFFLHPLFSFCYFPRFMPTEPEGASKGNRISIPLRRMTQAELDAFLEKAADILRGNVDHSEFRGYVFALLFFKRISDLFQEAVRRLTKDVGDDLARDPLMQKKALPFVVPADSIWEVVTYGTKEKPVTSTTLGQSLNDAMLAIERA